MTDEQQISAPKAPIPESVTDKYKRHPLLFACGFFLTTAGGAALAHVGTHELLLGNMATGSVLLTAGIAIFSLSLVAAFYEPDGERVSSQYKPWVDGAWAAKTVGGITFLGAELAQSAGDKALVKGLLSIFTMALLGLLYCAYKNSQPAKKNPKIELDEIFKTPTMSLTLQQETGA